MRITVCITTCNRDMGLKMCLHALMAMDPIDFPWDIIVVDNFCSQSTKVVCDSFNTASEIAVYYFEEQQKGIPFARNKALKQARELSSDAVLFIDDDEYPHKEWLKTIVNYA